MPAPEKTLREGSALKRAAILGAAQELFLADGFERASVDAIAARAGVSKRTVYDYFGDKRTLLVAVVEQARDSLTRAIQRAVEENLEHVVDLEQALIELARAILTGALGSPDYSALIRLVSMEYANLAELSESWDDPENVLTARFADFDRQGLLDAPDPRLAVDHFVALTLSSTASTLSHGILPDADSDRAIVEGVRAFLRAYAPRSAGAAPDPR